VLASVRLFVPVDQLVLAVLVPAGQLQLVVVHQLVPIAAQPFALVLLGLCLVEHLLLELDQERFAVQQWFLLEPIWFQIQILLVF
jgi:hypothetical protein